MTKPQVTVVVLLLAACGNSWARDKTVTIIYDVDLREFVCWYEGERIPPTKDPSTKCDPARPQNHATNAHKYAPGLYFFRGQTVRVQLQNARLIDVFTADLQVGDLAIPSIAIFGGLTELPSLKPLGAAEKVVSAAGVTLATAAPARSPGDDLDQGLDQWTKDELNAYLKENLHDIAGGEKLLAALSWRPESTIGSLQSLLEKDKPLIVQALSVRTDLDQVQPLLDNLRKIYCAPAAPITNTDDVQNYLSAVRLLTRAIERQQSLKDQIGITELATLSKTLTDQFTAAGDEEIRHALEYSVDSLKDFRTRFENAFPPAQRRARIRAIKLDQKKYTLDAVAAEFLDHLNNQGDKDDASLKRLQDNLNVLSDQWQKVSAEIDRLDTLRGNVDKVTRYFSAKSEPEDKRDVWKFWELQQVLEGIGLRAISAAEAGNCVAASMTLPEAISAPVVNQWYGSKEITLTLKRGTRVPLFDLAGVTEASRANVKEQPAAPAGTVQGSTTEPTTARQTVFSIHDLFHYQVAFGFIRSALKDVEYTLATQTVTENGTNRTVQSFQQTKDRSYRFLPTVDLLIYPFARDFFPWTARYPEERPPLWWKRFAGLAGFSLSSPTKDFFFGGAYMSNWGLGLKSGVHLGYVDQLPANAPLNQPLTGPIAVIRQTLDKAYFVGVTMNAQFFKDTFAVIFK
jgi:hypothetical protein